MRAASTSFGLLSIPALIGLLGLCGCEKTLPPITKRTYTIPAVIVKQQAERAQVEKNREKQEADEKKRSEHELKNPIRMLAAIVSQPDTDSFWTFKIFGTPEKLEPIKPQLTKLLASLKWKTKSPVLPEWQLPEGWQVTADEDDFGRVATIFFRADGTFHEIAVGRFTNRDDWELGVLSNLNRWRGQLKLEPISLDDLATAVKEIPFSGGEALLQDITSLPPAKPEAKTPEATPPEKNTPPEPEPNPVKNNEPKSGQTADGLLTYEYPAAWQMKQPSAFRVASFDVSEDGKKADVALSVFSTDKTPDMGKLLPNVNRWRGELGLKPVTESELPEQTTELKIPAGTATIFTGTGTRQDAPATTLAAMLLRGDSVWFVKIQGDATLVSKQRPAFEEFLKSLKFKE